jgi:hypothetical protein
LLNGRRKWAVAEDDAVFDAPSTGVTATPVTTGLRPRIVAWSDCAPVATAPVAMTEIRLSLTSFWPQVVPSSSFDLMKH